MQRVSPPWGERPWAEIEDRLRRYPYREVSSPTTGAEAIVIDRSVVENRFVDLHHVRYRFETAGESIERAESVGERIHDRVREGSRLEVLHLPSDPREAMIAGNDEASRLASIWGMIDVLLVVAGWWVWKSNRVNRPGAGG